MNLYGDIPESLYHLQCPTKRSIHRQMLLKFDDWYVEIHNLLQIEYVLQPLFSYDQ